MKALSQYVRLRQQMVKHHADHRAVSQMQAHQEYTTRLVLSDIELRDSYETALAQSYKATQQQIKNWDDTVAKVLQDLDSRIDALNHSFMTSSELAYFRTRYDKHLEVKDLNCEPDDMVYIYERWGAYNDWRLPGLVLGCTNVDLIKSITALDPMYLVDTDHDRMNESVQQFTEKYRYRVRRYINSKNDLLANLPRSQIGWAASWNYLNYLPWSEIRTLLDRMWQVLRPGGSFGFTYNNCDAWQNCLAFENGHTVSFVTGRMIKDYATVQGWQVTNAWSDGALVHWIELQKPGEISTIRGGQTLGRIHADPENVRRFIEQQIENEKQALERQRELEKLFEEIEHKKKIDEAMRTRQQHEDLIARALVLNISDPRAYEPNKLRKIVERREMILAQNKFNKFNLPPG